MAEQAWSPPSDVEAVRSALLAWFESNRRPFPWRSVDDPWQLLVLEVMSQQTQLERVTEPWETFVERWPTADAVATSDPGDVVAFWSEHRLGYNRRAAYLHEAATTIVEDHDGAVPDTVDALTELAGVGPYTANAVASFAFGTGGPVIDTNVKRVLHRAFGVPDETGAFADAAETLAPPEAIGAWNGAIMELGGVACTKTPRCDEAACPWRSWCSAYASGDFTAPDVPTQPAYEGSRRQSRGRVLDALRSASPQSLATLGPRVRVDFDPDDDADRAWLRDLLDDLADDGLVERNGEIVSLPGTDRREPGTD